MATKKEVLTKKCTKCGIDKKIGSNNYYKSYSVIFASTEENRMCICKDCVLELAEQFKNRFNSELRGLYELCKLLDVYYEKATYNTACVQSEKTDKKGNPYQIYFQKILSLPQNKNKTFIDSELFDKKEDIENINNDIGHDLVDMWGDGLSQSDYNYLDREFEKMLVGYECDSYAQEALFQEVCFQRLDIKKKRQNGSSVDKELRTLQDLLGSANIKPAQESASLASDQLTFGTLIKKFENEKPIPEPLPSWMTSNWIEKYVKVFFFGNMCRMMGKPNPYVEEYKEEMDKYTVKPPDNSYEGDIDG